MRLIKLAIVTVLFALSWPSLRAQSNPVSKQSNYSKARANISPHPQSVETGTEQIKENWGFLQCATQVLKIDHQHDDTNQASANLTSVPDKTDSAVIVGHGGRGLQCTGDGDHCGQDAKMLAYFNVATWQPMLAKLRDNFHSLTLLGCNVGKGIEGDNLLTAVAKATQMPVKAPDRMIFCGAQGITLIDGKPITWIEVEPDGAIVQPHKESQAPVKHEIGRFKISGTFQKVPMSAVTLVELQYRGYRSSEFRVLRVRDMSALLSFIDFEHPIETKGRPGAIATGKVRLGLKFGSDTIEKNFILYNDELLQDIADPDIFYEGSDSLAEYMTRFTR